MLTKLVFIGIIEVILLGFGAAAIWFVEIGAIWFVKIGWYKLKMPSDRLLAKTLESLKASPKAFSNC